MLFELIYISLESRSEFDIIFVECCFNARIVSRLLNRIHRFCINLRQRKMADDFIASHGKIYANKLSDLPFGDILFRQQLLELILQAFAVCQQGSGALTLQNKCIFKILNSKFLTHFLCYVTSTFNRLLIFVRSLINRFKRSTCCCVLTPDISKTAICVSFSDSSISKISCL